MAKEIKLPWLLLGSILTSIGMSFIWPLTSVYLHDQLGISLAVIGVVLFFNSLASVVGNLVGGLLYDHFNPYRLLVGGALFTVASLAGMIFFHGWPNFGVGLFFVGLGSGWNATLVATFGASIKKYDGRYVFNMLYFAQNLGTVLGTALVGFVYDYSVTLLFILATVLYVGFTLIALFAYRPIRYVKRHDSSTTSTEKNFKNKLAGKNILLLNIFFLILFFAWVMYQQWVSNLSVYMTGMGIPLSSYSLLWTLNAGLIVLIQLILVRISRWIKETIYQIYFGLLMLALSFFVLLLAKSYLYFVVAMLVLTLGEATAFPAIPALIHEYTPQSVKGRYLGLANSFAAAGRAVGPLFGGLLIDGASYQVLFVVAGLTDLILLAGLLFMYRLTKNRLHVYRE